MLFQMATVLSDGVASLQKNEIPSWLEVIFSSFLSDGFFTFLVAPLLPILLVLVLCLVCFFFVGKRFGLPWLFWHDSRPKLVLTWLAFSIFLGNVAFVAYLNDVGRLAYTNKAPTTKPSTTKPSTTKPCVRPERGAATLECRLASLRRAISLRRFRAMRLAKEHWLLKFAAEKRDWERYDNRRIVTSQGRNQGKDMHRWWIRTSALDRVMCKSYWFSDLLGLGYVFYYLSLLGVVAVLAFFGFFWPGGWWREIHSREVGEHQSTPQESANKPPSTPQESANKPPSTPQKSANKPPVRHRLFFASLGFCLGVVFVMLLFFGLAAQNACSGKVSCVHEWVNTFGPRQLWWLCACAPVFVLGIALTAFSKMRINDNNNDEERQQAKREKRSGWWRLLFGVSSFVTFFSLVLALVLLFSKGTPLKLLLFVLLLPWPFAAIATVLALVLFYWQWGRGWNGRSILAVLLLFYAIVCFLVQTGNLLHFIDKARVAPELHISALAVFLLLVFLTWVAAVIDVEGEYMGPGMMVCILFSLFVSIYGVATFTLVAPWFLLLCCVVLVGAFSGSTYKYRFRDLADLYEPSRRIKLPTMSTWRTELPPTRKVAFHPKCTNNAASGSEEGEAFPLKRGPLVLVAACGGGITAGAWTIGVLKSLEKKLPGFRKQVAVICGASGGMLGAAYYAATAHIDPEPAPDGVSKEDDKDREKHSIDDTPRQQMLRACYRNLTEDFLSPVARRLALNDFWRSIGAAGPIKHDRGEELQRVWEARLKQVGLRAGEARDAESGQAGQVPLQMGFDELFALEKEGKIPSLVFAPVMVEDARRLIISNLDMTEAIHHYTALPGGGFECSCSALQARDLFDLNRVESAKNTQKASFRLSTAVRMSATFPYVSPAAELPTVPARRIVDAGYSDNYGVNLLASWLEAHKEEIQEKTDGVLLLQIDMVPRTEALAHEQIIGSRPHGLMKALEELISPAEGILGLREPGVAYRNNQQLASLSKWRFPGTDEDNASEPKRPFFTTLHIPLEFSDNTTQGNLRKDEAPLSWYLTNEDKRIIEKAFDCLLEEEKPMGVGGGLSLWWDEAMKRGGKRGAE